MGKGRRGDAWERLSCDNSGRGWFARSWLAPVVATFIALFIALLNFFFPRRKEQGEEGEEEEAPDRFLK